MNNVVNLIGRLGDKPTCRTLSDGGRVANFSLATDDGYRGANGKWVKRTTWHRITVFGEKRVDYIEAHYAKGDLVQFTGRLGYSLNERGDTKYHNTQLIGSTSLLASVKRDREDHVNEADEYARGSEPGDNWENEIPF